MPSINTSVKIGLTAESKAIFQAVCDVCARVCHVEIEFRIDSVMLYLVLCMILWVTLLRSGSLPPDQSCTCHVTPPLHTLEQQNRPKHGSSHDITTPLSLSFFAASFTFSWKRTAVSMATAERESEVMTWRGKACMHVCIEGGGWVTMTAAHSLIVSPPYKDAAVVVIVVFVVQLPDRSKTEP